MAIDLKMYRDKKAKATAPSAPPAITCHEPQTNFFRVSHPTITHKHWQTLTPIAKLVYIALCAARNRYQRGSKEYFWVTDPKLMKFIGLSLSSIKRGRNELKENRLIVHTSGKGKRSRYQILDLEQMEKNMK